MAGVDPKGIGAAGEALIESRIFREVGHGRHPRRAQCLGLDRSLR
jgi:hypothetical protein